MAMWRHKEQKEQWRCLGDVVVRVRVTNNNEEQRLKYICRKKWEKGETCTHDNIFFVLFMAPQGPGHTLDKAPDTSTMSHVKETLGTRRVWWPHDWVWCTLDTTISLQKMHNLHHSRDMFDDMSGALSNVLDANILSFFSWILHQTES